MYKVHIWFIHQYFVSLQKTWWQVFYENVSNSLINCIINDLILDAYWIVKASVNTILTVETLPFWSQIRGVWHFTKKVINENKRLKEINFLQQKQIKRFLKVVNVDNLSDQLEKLAILVNINPFITLNNCLNLAESYDMISICWFNQWSNFQIFIRCTTIYHSKQIKTW